MQGEMIYDRMAGLADGSLFPVQGNVNIEDEFAEGKECGCLYEEVYRAKQNLCGRLGEAEDKDVETIIGTMEKITRLLAIKMYEYGRMGLVME